MARGDYERPVNKRASVFDTRHKQNKFKSPPERWVAVCLDHDTVEFGPNKVAQIERARKREFCQPCNEGVEPVAQPVPAEPVEEPVSLVEERKARAEGGAGPQRAVKAVAPGAENVTETLSCGHELEFAADGYTPAKRRRCAGCLHNVARTA